MDVFSCFGHTAAMLTSVAAGEDWAYCFAAAVLILVSDWWGCYDEVNIYTRGKLGELLAVCDCI